MSLTYRILRLLGWDTVERFSAASSLYEFTVTHIDGGTSTVVATGYRHMGAFLEFYEDVSARVFHNGVGYDVRFVSETTRELGSVKEVDYEKIGRTVAQIEYDKADDTEKVDVWQETNTNHD